MTDTTDMPLNADTDTDAPRPPEALNGAANNPVTIKIDPQAPQTLTLTFAQVNIVLGGLGKLPAEESYEVITLIRNQVLQQNMPAPTEH